jgi:hypothetical protein
MLRLSGAFDGGLLLDSIPSRPNYYRRPDNWEWYFLVIPLRGELTVPDDAPSFVNFQNNDHLCRWLNSRMNWFLNDVHGSGRFSLGIEVVLIA